MNKEDRKRLEEIEEKRRRREAGLSYGDECPDEDWLISQLKAEAAEVEQLRIDVRDWKGLADRTATAIVEYGAMRERAEDKCADAKAERDKLRKLLRATWERMDRARSILRDPLCGGNPTSNWGMLDTSIDRAALEEK